MKNLNKNFINKISQLTFFHYKNCVYYRKILDRIGFKSLKNLSLAELPFLPVRIFKDYDLLSVKKNKIVKVLLSSGTTGTKQSSIFLDRKNSINQIKTLQKIMFGLLNQKEKIPMLIVSQNIQSLDRLKFNAKIAAINGFSMFGRDHTYLLNSKGDIDYKILNNFLKKNKNKKFLIFGFTADIFNYLINNLNKRKINNDFSKAILLHGGGWKKLEKIKISNSKFKFKLTQKLNLSKIVNYYGLIEQVGSIFLECKCGYFNTTDYSDILIRDKNFNILGSGSKGFLQIFSILPTSYPGHNILTEDVGEIIDDKNCKCHPNKKKFLVHGRFPKAEPRGCGNV